MIAATVPMPIAIARPGAGGAGWLPTDACTSAAATLMPSAVPSVSDSVRPQVTVPC